MDRLPTHGPHRLATTRSNDSTSQIQQSGIEGPPTQIDRDRKPSFRIELDKRRGLATCGCAPTGLDYEPLTQQHSGDIGNRRLTQFRCAGEIGATDRAVVKDGLQDQPPISLSCRLMPSLGVWAQPGGPRHDTPFHDKRRPQKGAVCDQIASYSLTPMRIPDAGSKKCILVVSTVTVTCCPSCTE